MSHLGACRRINVLSLFFCLIVLAAAPSAFSQYSTVLNGAPEIRSGSIAGSDTTQTGRINRDGLPSSCAGGAPSAAPLSGTYHYDQYPFTNPTGQEACVTVEYDMSACGGTANNSTQVNAYSTFDPANSNSNVIGKPGFSTIASGTLSFKVNAGQSFVIVVHEVVANGGCSAYNFALKYHTSGRQAGFDRTSDGKADPAFYRPSTGEWSIIDSAGGTSTRQFGIASDIITAADYTGDNQTDLSVYRPGANTWFYASDQANPAPNSVNVPWGIAGDVPVPGDYDKDGKGDIAVFRPSVGNWYILKSSTNAFAAFHWGQAGDTPVAGDYDGDLTNDLAVVRNESGNLHWFILQSNFNYGFVLGCGTTTPSCTTSAGNFGITGDRIVSGDFDGDLRSDIAIYRPSDGFWWYRSSAGVTVGSTVGPTVAQQWGIAEDIPQPADYDGDKKTDVAVFRPSTGAWYIHNSGANTLSAYAFGTATDQPASSPYRVSNP